MSASLLDDLLAGYVTPVRIAHAAPTPANSANSAKTEHSCGLAPALTLCEGLRIPANSAGADTEASPDSQTFAGVRNPATVPQSEEIRGSSQNSQLSHGYPLQCAKAGESATAAVAWTDAGITAYLNRRARLMRSGWAEPDAEKLAERLVRRDHEQDGRVSCADCHHYRPSRCGNHKRAGLNAPEIGRDLATLLQRCGGFEASR